MFKKLVFMSGKPFWLLPEGDFLAVEQKNGRIVDPVLFRKSNDRWNSEAKSPANRETKRFPFRSDESAVSSPEGEETFLFTKEAETASP